MERRQREQIERKPVERETTDEQPKAENAEYLAPGVYVEETSLKTPIDNEGNPLDVMNASLDPGPSVTGEPAGYTDSFGVTWLDGGSSAYIGETEKNLSQQLDSSEGAGGAMFFDEADAVFGKRTEVQDSHDRYANQEVSYAIGPDADPSPGGPVPVPYPNAEGQGVEARQEDPGTQAGWNDAHDTYANQEVSYVRQETEHVFRPEIGDEVVAGNAEPTKLVEALGSEIIVHQREESGETPRINEEVELVGRDGVTEFATTAPPDTPWSVQSVSVDPAETGFVAVDKDNFNELGSQEIIVDMDPADFATAPGDPAGFVEVPADAAEALRNDLAGNDNEWRAAQEQIEPEPQGFIIHELEKRGEAETQLGGDEPFGLNQPDSPTLVGDEGVWLKEPGGEQMSSTYLDVWERPVTGLQADSTDAVAGVWKAPAGTEADIAGMQIPEEQPLEFKAVSGMDELITWPSEANSMDETPRLVDDADTSNVMVGMGQKDAYVESAQPELAEEQAAELLLPAVQLTDDPLTSELESMSIDDDDDSFDGI